MPRKGFVMERVTIPPARLHVGVFATAGLALVCLLPACGGGVSSQTSSTSSGGSVLLSASPESLSFGCVVVGNSSQLAFSLTNSGTKSVTVSQAQVTGAGYSVASPSFPITLAEGKSAWVDIAFAPAAAGSVAGTLSVVSNASNSPAALSLSGTGGVNPRTVSLSWDASGSSGVAGYNVYRGSISGGPYSKLNPTIISSTSVLTYTDSTVQVCQTYYYVATAVGTDGSESGYSNPPTEVTVN